MKYRRSLRVERMVRAYETAWRGTSLELTNAPYRSVSGSSAVEHNVRGTLDEHAHMVRAWNQSILARITCAKRDRPLNTGVANSKR